MTSLGIELPYAQEAEMQQASEVFATRLELARQGVPLKPQHDLIWKIPFQGRAWPVGSKEWARGQHVRKMMEDREAGVEALRVNRDPCPRCNTRRDIGCKHFPRGEA